MLTKQEIFNTVRDHLLTQGTRSTNKRGRCAYRGEDGARCAVGALIPDHLYDPTLEDLGVWSTFLDSVMYECGVPSELRADDKMVGQLQRIHDRTLPEDWSYELTRLAEREGLTP